MKEFENTAPELELNDEEGFFTILPDGGSLEIQYTGNGYFWLNWTTHSSYRDTSIDITRLDNIKHYFGLNKEEFKRCSEYINQKSSLDTLDLKEYELYASSYNYDGFMDDEDV